MGFLLGKESGVKFRSSTREGMDVNLYADEWTIDIKDEAIDITSIQPLRDADIEGDLSANDDWYKFGVPSQKINGGIKDIVVNVHGFVYWDQDYSDAEGPRFPVTGERGKLEILYTPVNANFRRPLFTCDSVVVIDSKYNTDIDSGIEFDIEFHCLTTDVDIAPYPGGI